MRDTWPLLANIAFPSLRRGGLDTLQANVGYRCNQSCGHCHVNAGPGRTQAIDAATVDLVLDVLKRRQIPTLDITGGAPELNPQFRRLVRSARRMGVRVMDRCNLTVLEQPGQGDLPQFLAGECVEVIASRPCYLEDNVDRQRGHGVFDGSSRALRALNALGYGSPDTGLELNLVYNPQGPSLPPGQVELERDYKRELSERYGILCNRFGTILLAEGQFDAYLALLRNAHLDRNLEGVMCRNLISVDYRGFVYDCDFNQMLDLPLTGAKGRRVHLSELMDEDIVDNPINVAGHCFGCTAGQGSSCGGALKPSVAS
jgi:radical SAM/Cys-rich protein